MNKIFSAITTFVFVMLFATISCAQTNNQTSLKIALTKQSKSYTGWIERHEENVEFFNLYEMNFNNAMRLLAYCDGLILTGGEDVFPGFYNQTSDTLLCGTIDRYRDSLEFAAIDMAIKLKMPILGVCRGEQILNISQGGSLYVDVPSEYDTLVVHRQKDWKNCYHQVFLVEESDLAEISAVTVGDVTSNHHQGIKKLGKGLKITAYTADSLPEAIEWEVRGNKGFLMAVQWHPERMDTLHPLSAPIAKEFLKEAELYRNR